MKLCQVALMLTLLLTTKVAASATSAASQPPFTVQVAPNGAAMILDGRHLVGTVVPQVFTEGWQMASYEDRSHWGWVNGFNSTFYVDRDAKQAVVVWVNDGVNGHSTGLLVRLLLEGYATWDHDLSDLTDLTDDPVPEADKLAGTYVNREIPTGGAATPELVVKVKDGKLFAHTIGRSEIFDFRIYAKRDGTLFAKGPLYSPGGNEIVTIRNDKGEITGFSFRSGGFRVERKNQP